MKTPKVSLDLSLIFAGRHKMTSKRRATKSKKSTGGGAMSKDATPVQPAQITVDSKMEDIGLASEKSSPSNESMASSGSYRILLC